MVDSYITVYLTLHMELWLHSDSASDLNDKYDTEDHGITEKWRNMTLLQTSIQLLFFTKNRDLLIRPGMQKNPR